MNRSPPPRWILHADMDAFYASIEQRDRPELRGRPVIVGATSPRGVVAAASYEARRFGVRSAMPGFRARQLCPQGVYLPADMARYARVSDDIHAVFTELTPIVEPLALDEAFLDVTGSVGLFGGPLALARHLRTRVRERTELSISVGVAPNKLVAKIACSLGKPDGLLVVPPQAVRWLLDPLPVRRLWGVGPVVERSLVAQGLRSLGELARADPERLRRAIGDRAAELVHLARGEDRREVVADREPRSIGEENTFGKDVADRARIGQAITAHAEAVARRARRAGYCGRTVTVKVKLGRRHGARTARAGTGDEPAYPLLTRSRTLAAATDDGAAIRRVALALWSLAGVTEPIRLVGVTLSGLEPSRDPQQLELFEAGSRAARLGPALDAIEARFGKGAVRRAVADPEKATHTDQRKRGD